MAIVHEQECASYFVISVMRVAHIGADVTHPMGFASTEPSIAAVVASMDRYCGRFAAEVMLQVT